MHAVIGWSVGCYRILDLVIKPFFRTNGGDKREGVTINELLSKLRILIAAPLSLGTQADVGIDYRGTPGVTQVIRRNYEKFISLPPFSIYVTPRKFTQLRGETCAKIRLPTRVAPGELEYTPGAFFFFLPPFVFYSRRNRNDINFVNCRVRRERWIPVYRGMRAKSVHKSTDRRTASGPVERFTTPVLRATLPVEFAKSARMGYSLVIGRTDRIRHAA